MIQCNVILYYFEYLSQHFTNEKYKASIQGRYGTIRYQYGAILLILVSSLCRSFPQGDSL